MLVLVHITYLTSFPFVQSYPSLVRLPLFNVDCHNRNFLFAKSHIGVTFF